MKKRTDFSLVMWIVVGCLLIGLFMGFMIGVKFNPNNDGNKILSCSSVNISRLTLDSIGAYCKEHTPKGYSLHVWWDGCSTRDERITFQCGYINSDQAVKYDCYDINELLK